MNRIYLIIKGWIILQLTNLKNYLKNWWLSLFTKKVPEMEHESSTTNELLQPPDELLQEDEIDQDISLEEENETSNDVFIEDSIPEITVNIQQDSSSHSEELAVQQPEVVLYDGKYDIFFNTPYTPVPSSLVQLEIWNVLQDKLPEHYTIPAPSQKNIYNHKGVYK